MSEIAEFEDREISPSCGKFGSSTHPLLLWKRQMKGMEVCVFSNIALLLFLTSVKGAVKHLISLLSKIDLFLCRRSSVESGGNVHRD